MKWLNVLIVIIAIIASYLIELYWLSFLLVMLLVLVVFVELAKGTAKVGVKTGKVLTKGMWTGLEKA